MVKIKIEDIASYISFEYKRKYKQALDDNKLGKLLYFAQRESYIVRQKPLFEEHIYAFKTGPTVLFSKRRMALYDSHLIDIAEYSEIINKIVDFYAVKSELSLMNLSFGEISWKNAYDKMISGEKKSFIMDEKDIEKDALKIRIRRNNKKME